MAETYKDLRNDVVKIGGEKAGADLDRLEMQDVADVGDNDTGPTNRAVNRAVGNDLAARLTKGAQAVMAANYP